MQILALVACFLVGLYIDYLFTRRFISSLLWGMGSAGDMIVVAVGLMIGCLIYSFLLALLPKDKKNYIQRVGNNVFNVFFITYGVLIVIVLYARTAPLGINMSAVQLVPFKDILGLILLIYHHQINLPYAYAILIGNIILFTPLAFLIRPHFKTALKCFMVLLVMFTFLEAMQFITNRGIFDIDDIIKYSLGVPIGFGIRKIVDNKVRPRR